ncbi:MAG: CHASE2 domain-containing protein [Phormidesmis sp.]
MPGFEQRLGQVKGLKPMIPGLLVGLIVVLLMKLNAWQPLERTVSAQMMRDRGSLGWDPRVVMISIDDKSLQRLGQFPISRDCYSELIKVLIREDASVVVFNLLFSEEMAAGRDLDESRAENARLARAMSEQGHVVIGQAWGPNKTAIKPVPVLAETAIAVGHLGLQASPDAITRWVDITVENIPTLGVAAIQAYGLSAELVSIPSELKRLYINWPGPAQDLTRLSLIDVLNGQFSPGALTGKIVVVGYGATTGQGQLRTPFDYQVPIPGGYMHAAVIDNLLRQSWLRLVPSKAVAVGVLLGSPLLSLLLYRRQTWMQLLIGMTLLAGWIFIDFAALHFFYQLPTVAPLMAIALTSTVVIALSRLQSNALLQVRSAFLNTMSHEIRTPLNAIVNLAEMLQETPLDAQQREFATTLTHSSQTLLALINDVLDFSKIESGQFTLEDSPVNLSDAIERSFELVAPLAAEKNLEMVYAIAPSTPAVVRGDPVRLQQILLNLLGNAVKFTPAGEISIQVQSVPLRPQTTLFSLQNLSQRLKLEPGSRRQVERWKNPPAWRTTQSTKPNLYEIRFAVSDTGIGIPPQQIARLFEPFSQVSATTTRKYGGTGLGLAISKRLSKQMGGDLWAKSRPRKGSTFYFTVQAELAEMTMALPGCAPSLKGSRVLLIDRNAIRRQRLMWQLQPLKITLAIATSLTEGLACLQSQSDSRLGGHASAHLSNTAAVDGARFDGVILDEAVTAVSEGCAREIATLRRLAGNDHLPVIILSSLQSTHHGNGHQNRRLEDRTLERRLQDSASALSPHTSVLWKPVKRAALYQLLSQALPAAQLPSCPVTLVPRLSAAPAIRQSDLSTQARESSVAILIAEDNRINQRVTLRLLELLGYAADVVGSGTAVLAALKQQHYDVILMDMRMPELDGLETTRKIRQMASGSDLWIIAMTANTMAEDRQQCFAAGMNDYLSKPIKREALRQALQRCSVRRGLGSDTA